MVSELTRNNCRHIVMLFVLFLICTILFCGCDPRSGRYPFQRSEQWYCEDPQISLNYSKQEEGTWEMYETLLYDGDVKEIILDMHSSDYWVFPASSDNITHHDDMLFSGSWKYRNGNLVLVVEEDFIFDGKYSRIILKPVAGEAMQ